MTNLDALNEQQREAVVSEDSGCWYWRAGLLNENVVTKNHLPDRGKRRKSVGYPGHHVYQTRPNQMLDRLSSGRGGQKRRIRGSFARQKKEKRGPKGTSRAREYARKYKWIKD